MIYDKLDKVGKSRKVLFVCSSVSRLHRESLLLKVNSHIIKSFLLYRVYRDGSRTVASVVSSFLFNRDLLP